MSSYVDVGYKRYGGRGRPRNQDLDHRILDAAVQELMDKGFGGVSTYSVAKRAGVGRAAIARRYLNTLDLVSEAILFGTGVTSVDKSRHFFNDLYEMADNNAKSAARGDMPRVLAAAFIEESRHPELITMYRKAVGWPRRQMIRDALRNGVARDEVRRDVGLDVVVDLILGAAMERRYAGLYVGDTYTADVLNIVLRGALRPEIAPFISMSYEQ